MFWVAICFLLFLIWGGNSLLKGIMNYKPADPDALNPTEECNKFMFSVKDYDYKVSNEVKAAMKPSDIWDFLGRTPSDEEKKITEGFSFLYRDFLIRNALMSRKGKLEGMFILGQQYPTKDPAYRAFIDQVYLKIEDTLESQGVHNVVTVKNLDNRQYPLRSVASGGHHSSYGDQFTFANVNPVYPETGMYYLKNKPDHTHGNGDDEYGY